MPDIIRDGEIVNAVTERLAQGESGSADQAYLHASDVVTIEDLSSVYGIWIETGDDWNVDAFSIDGISRIAIHFPVFADGRGFSIARMLRDRLKFTGDLMACGGIVRDQLHYLRQCGFNSFALEDGSDLEVAKQSLDTFSKQYQQTVRSPDPVFRQNA